LIFFSFFFQKHKATFHTLKNHANMLGHDARGTPRAGKVSNTKDGKEKKIKINIFYLLFFFSFLQKVRKTTFTLAQSARTCSGTTREVAFVAKTAKTRCAKKRRAKRRKKKKKRKEKKGKKGKTRSSKYCHRPRHLKNTHPNLWKIINSKTQIIFGTRFLARKKKYIFSLCAKFSRQLFGRPKGPARFFLVVLECEKKFSEEKKINFQKKKIIFEKEFFYFLLANLFFSFVNFIFFFCFFAYHFSPDAKVPLYCRQKKVKNALF